MREIKFKIWTGGHMLRSEDYPCFPFYIGATDGKVYQGRLEKGEHDLAETGFMPLQYTGVKDRNGREIYEGDIIEFLENESGETWTAKIVFENLAFKALDVEDEGYEYDFDDLTDIEVIGNIYENPEILKDTK